MATTVKVRRRGNGLGILLPTAFIAERHIVEGTVVEIDGLTVVGDKPRRRSPYKLRDILKNYTSPGIPSGR